MGNNCAGNERAQPQTQLDLEKPWPNSSSKSMLDITINGIEVMVPVGVSILEACRHFGFFIPSLCYHSHLKPLRVCGVCGVWIEVVVATGRREGKMVDSCGTLCEQSMSIKTSHPEVQSSRQYNINRLFENVAIPIQHYRNKEIEDLIPFVSKKDLQRQADNCNRKISKGVYLDESSFALTRDMNICIGCTRCVEVCLNIQSIGNLTLNEQGKLPPVTCNFLNPSTMLADTDCVSCGQCSVYCPTGAISHADASDALQAAFRNPELTIVLQIAPAVRVAIAECFNKPIGTVATNKLVSAAREIGFKYVFDTNFGADLCVMEEGTELIERVRHGGPFPMFTSCCPGWINHVARSCSKKEAEENLAFLLPNISETRSPMQMMGAILKSFWADKQKIQPKNLFVVAVSPCVAKKVEIEREEGKVDDLKLVDLVLTTTQFADLIRSFNINWDRLPDDGVFDSVLGESSGAAALFGVTGGVTEAALRTAHYLMTGSPMESLVIDECRGFRGFREATFNMCGTELKVAIVHGMKQIKKIMKRMKKGDCPYHFIEVMCCPSGCIGGGGQPAQTDPECMKLRRDAIYSIDKEKSLKESHKNPEITAIYAECLEKPCSEKAKKLLHTNYSSWSDKSVLKKSLRRADDVFFEDEENESTNDKIASEEKIAEVEFNDAPLYDDIK